MVSINKIKRASLNMLKPYSITKNSPYLSEDQCELSKLSMEQRAIWMADWLYLANDYQKGSSILKLASKAG